MRSPYPSPRHASSHFFAFNEMAKLRGYRGINCHLALIHPSDILARVVVTRTLTLHATLSLTLTWFRPACMRMSHTFHLWQVVIDKARTASYIPYTRGAQDVIETIFATQVGFGNAASGRRTIHPDPNPLTA